jgi:hypothetical protein
VKLYRYTTDGEGTWSAGKRLLPEKLVGKVNKARKWLKKPDLPEGNYTFYLTQLGKDKYEQTLLHLHKQYLDKIKLEESLLEPDSIVVYQDEYQVVVKQ